MNVMADSTQTDREPLRLLVLADDGEAVEDLRQLFATPSGPPSGPPASPPLADESGGAPITSGVLGGLKAELFGAAAHHDAYSEVELACYRSGGEGVQALRQALDEARPFAIALVDRQLAPGLDWLQTAEQIRAWDPRLQIVMVAGHSEVHPMDICLRVPPADRLFFVQKPFHALEVKQLVHALGAKWRNEAVAVGVRRATEVPAPANAQAMLAAVQHYPVGAMVFDARDSLLAANPECVRLFPELADVLAAGLGYEEVCRLMAERLLGDDTLYAGETWIRDRIDWHGRGGGVTELRLKGERWVLLVERCTGQDLTYCHFIDITEAKARERSRTTAAQMTAMAQAFTGVCRRLALLDDGPSTSASDGPAALLQDPQIAVLHQTERQEPDDQDALGRAALNRKLLGVAQKLRLDPQAADLNRLVAELVQGGKIAAAGKTVEVVAGAGLWEVQIDKAAFAAALGELLGNAAEALQEGKARPGEGRILVESANVRLSRDFAAARSGLNPGEYVRVSVEDDGPGMSAEMSQRAVNPFFGSKSEAGHDGLGLSFVYGFVEQSGGHLEIQSGLGEGTRVELYFPRSAVETASGGADVHVVTTRRRTQA